MRCLFVAKTAVNSRNKSNFERNVRRGHHDAKFDQKAE